MKKQLLAIILFPVICLSHLNADNHWINAVNTTFDSLEKNKISSEILLDYAMEFTDAATYGGTLDSDNYVNLNVYGNIYKRLFMGKVIADTLNTPLYNRFANNLAREICKRNKDAPNHIILSGLVYEYQILDSLALGNNSITVTNNRYDDRYINMIDC